MTICKWFFFLSKRLYKKWMFLLLIALIPLSAAALRITSAQKSGFVQIAVVNAKGDIGNRIWETLTDNTKIIRYLRYDTLEPAAADLRANRLDAIWEFPDDLESRIASFVKAPTEEHYLVRVIQKEDSLKSRLALEKLSAAMYPYTSRPFFLRCVREDSDFDLSALSDEEIYQYYDNYFNTGNLFRFSFPDDTGAVKENEQNYMTAPVRGLLSAIVLLAGLAAALLFMSDEQKGVFSFAKSSRRIWISFAFQLTAALNIGFFVFCSTYLLGVNTGFWRESAILLLLILNTALFATVLQQVICNLTVFAPVAVFITVADIFICPIFFDFTVQRIPQLLFPNTYYINSVHSDTYLRYSLIYSGVLIAIGLALGRIRRNA